jgi:hypothetical protein
VRTRDLVVELDPSASSAVRLAALLHDMERAFPDTSGRWPEPAAWSDPEYRRWHAARSATVVREWLAARDAPPELVDDVCALIAVHEDGGWPEADLVQAADSVSFLETLTGVAAAWVREGTAIEVVEGKLRYMADRIRYAPARARAAGLLTPALAELRAAA